VISFLSALNQKKQDGVDIYMRAYYMMQGCVSARIIMKNLV
jgi:hypothetical protein